ncbi:hypothetical protein [Shouchella shacheensis]|uniref:hypothetical protein n=1 Tax=Shouchella shacheensis TaxID=1649580 RepID=UPI0007402F43|nr:hypothetical protein [Shouchella shacheensis]
MKKLLLSSVFVSALALTACDQGEATDAEEEPPAETSTAENEEETDSDNDEDEEDHEEDDDEGADESEEEEASDEPEKESDEGADGSDAEEKSEDAVAAPSAEEESEDSTSAPEAEEEREDAASAPEAEQENEDATSAPKAEEESEDVSEAAGNEAEEENAPVESEDNAGNESGETEAAPLPTDVYTHPRGQFAVDGAVGETVETDTGSFTIHKALNHIEPLQNGPVRITFENMSLISGNVTDSSIAGVAGDEVEYVQVDVVVQNTSAEPIQFHIDNTMLETGGQELHVHEMFSGAGKGYGDLSDQVPNRITLIYMLDSIDLGVGDIYSLYGVTDVPTNQTTGEAVGEPLKFDVSFSGAS